MAQVNSKKVLQQFDRLVDEETLFYSPAKPSFQTDEEFEFEFRIANSFKAKPAPNSTTTAQPSNRPPPTDGSDIDHSDPDFFIANIRDTHKLILNKFCIFRPQFLLLTLDPTKRQTEPLNVQDLTAAWETLRSLDGEVGEGSERHYVIYNGGVAGGSSRKHKHMQLLAKPKAEDGDLELVGDRHEMLQKLPCVFFFESLANLADLRIDEAGKGLASIAAEHYQQTRRALGIGDGDEETPVPHNVMLTSEWIITVPRRAATVEGRLAKHVVGCQGVLGSVWVSNEEQLAAWKEVGPTNVVRVLGVPKV